MKPWERVVFGLIALTVLAAIGVKLHELDMPVARFVRSFDIDELNRIGDLVALPGQGVVVAGAFIVIALIGWRRQRDQLGPMAVSRAGLIEWVRTWWPQRDQLTDIGVRGLLAQLSIAGAIQILKHLIGRPRDALPDLLRTYVPVAVPTFAILWVLLHPAPAWSHEIISLGVGIALVLAGGLVGGLAWTYLEGEDKGPLRIFGRLLLVIGVAVGCAPWWAAALLVVVLVPLGLAGLHLERAPAPASAHPWEIG